MKLSKYISKLMNNPMIAIRNSVVVFICVAACSVLAQTPEGPPDRGEPGAPPGGFPGFGGPPPFGAGGPPGFGGMMGQERQLVDRFDQNGDGRLNAEERQAARKYLAQEQAEGRGRRGPRGGFGRGGDNQEPPEPGEKLTPADVKSFGAKPLYDPMTLRTLFLQFEDADWEEELADFNNTDVEVPATLIADGKTYHNVGVHFRGMSSFMMVPEGRKRSLNISMDFVHEDQRLNGYKTLNLNNAHEDPTFLRLILYLQIAREYIPASKANFVRVVINGENWGIYQNAQQFNKDFIEEWFGTKQGARWKVPGSPNARGSLAYLGDDPEAYKGIYTIKSEDEPESWAALIHLCKVLNETPADQLVQALEPILDIDGALKFLALENALINNDGYWIRTSDYSLYRDKKGRFHVIPHDANETFTRPGGPGFGGPGFGRGRGPGGPRGLGGGPGGPNVDRANVQGVELDPLVAANDPDKPLISRLLAVPALRERYLGYIRDIAETWLDWNKLGPIAEQYHALIADDVKRDTRKLDSTEDFEKGLTEDIQGRGFGPAGRGTISLKNFADQRREYLLHLPAVQKAVNVEVEKTVEARMSHTTKGTSVVINEFMASNDSALADPQGDYDDWIELRNLTDQDVDLTGRYLSDNPSDPRKWPFPKGTTIPAHGYLLVWADEDGSDTPGLHANFKLDADGEELYLIDINENNNAVLDSVLFNKQETDRSSGRTAGNSEVWAVMNPTPGSANE